ncbi:MAG: TOBE domain-containing protein, partial [Burkholderiales bacterium]
DPPMNLLKARFADDGVRLDAGPVLALGARDDPRAAAASEVTVGVRAGALRVQPREGDIAIAGRVDLAEISGSDTFVHIASPAGPLVAQLTGVHYFEIGMPLTLHLAPAQVFLFGSDGALLQAPARGA